MTNWQRERFNPIDLLKERGWPCEHITYDPKLRKGDYSIIRSSAHDGTLLFTIELIDKALAPLANKASYHKPRQAEFLAAKDVHYTVGPARLATVFGHVDLPAGRYPGERQRIRIPVKATTV